MATARPTVTDVADLIGTVAQHIGEIAARKTFDGRTRRGQRPSEIHIGEAELAVIIAAAVQATVDAQRAALGGQ